MINLTPGERFLIQRRRRGQTRAQAAQMWGVKAHRIRDWEFGLGPMPPPRVELLPTHLSPNEICYILRLRSGLRPAELAQVLGVTAHTVLSWERGEGSAQRLYDYWRGAA
jgi:hypothetical protein